MDEADVADLVNTQPGSAKSTKPTEPAGHLRALAALLLLGSSGCLFAAPRYEGPLSDHWDGERFRNQVPMPERGFGSLLKWRFTSEPGEWKPWTDAVPGPKPPERIDGGRLRVTYVGHATLLVQMDGVNILTDPVWSERSSPVSWAGPRRARPPGLRFEDLPPIDAVLVTHNHYDHLDLDTLRRLDGAGRPRVITGLGNARLLTGEGIASGRVVELDWWGKADLSEKVSVRCVPGQHFSGRGIGDRDATLWCGFVIAGPSGRVYFAGDTAAGPHLKQVGERLGPLRLAILPIGAFRPEWFMRPVHLSPEDALSAMDELGARAGLAMHFGTFRMADDGQDEPVERLKAALARHPPPVPDLRVPGFGEGVEVP